MGHKTVPHHPFIVSRKYFISREHLSDGEMYHTPARISPHRDLQISPSPSQASLSSLHCSFTWHRRRPAKSSSHSLPQQNKSEAMGCVKCELDIAEVRACFYSGLRVYLSVSYVTQNVIARGALSWPGQLLLLQPAVAISGPGLSSTARTQKRNLHQNWPKTGPGPRPLALPSSRRNSH